MEVKDVVQRVAEIQLAAADNELAHQMEDSLWGDVLRAIAQGHPHADLLAEAALATGSIEFERWFA